MVVDIDNVNPKVSVLMTAYNREQYIMDAIESVLSSTYRNFELIIVDDSSTDATVRIAKKYAQKDSRITVYVNEKNLGDYANRNKAASYANGKYIMHCDSDDKLLPDGIAYCVSAMLQFPSVPFGMYLYGYDEGAVPFVLDSKEAINKHFFHKPFLAIGPGGTILNRQFFTNVNGYPERYGPSNDMYFNLKAACHAPILLLPFEFMFYRRHEGQEINNSYSYLINNFRYKSDALNELPLPLSKEQINFLQHKNKRQFLINIIQFAIRTKDLKRTMKAIKIAGYSFRDGVTAVFHYYTLAKRKDIFNQH